MNVFVSYQRADTALAAHALGYTLRLGGDEAFVDTGSIGVGELYRQVISNAVSTSNVVLALIGPSFDAQRLHEPTSVVTFEWQRARFHGTAVVRGQSKCRVLSRFAQRDDIRAVTQFVPERN